LKKWRKWWRKIWHPFTGTAFGQDAAKYTGINFAFYLGYKAARRFRTTLVLQTYFWTTP
jgi:hypothetical protein